MEWKILIETTNTECPFLFNENSCSHIDNSSNECIKEYCPLFLNTLNFDP
jgi:hypothetical protein